MTLKEFINYKLNCPICNSNLILLFHSDRRQSLKYEEDRIVIYFNLSDYKHSFKEQYKLGYSFDLNNNSFFIDFFNKEGKLYESVSEKLRFRFKELDKNLKKYKFKKICDSCRRYQYQSNDFFLDLKSAEINIQISFEYFGLINKNENNINLIRLNNDHIKNESSFLLTSESSELYATYNVVYDTVQYTKISNIIKYSSEKETFERIKKLVLFS